MRPAYFVVQRLYGREVPAVYWDELPREPLRGLVYVQRLDLFPNAERLCAASLDQLFAAFLHLRKRGKLPPRWEPPKPKQTSAAPSVGSE